MPASADLSPYGTYPPRGFVRATLAVTRALPANWLGLRTSMPLRRVAINALGDQPVDVPLSGHARAALSGPQQLREERAVHSAIAGRGRTHGAGGGD